MLQINILLLKVTVFFVEILRTVSSYNLKCKRVSYYELMVLWHLVCFVLYFFAISPY